MKTSARLRLVILIAVSFLSYVVFAGYGWVEAAARSRDAKQLLAALRSIELGKTTLQDVTELQSRFQRFSRAAPCTPASCAVTFRIENRWLHLTRLAPMTRLDASIWIKQDRAIQVNAFMIAVSRGAPSGDAAVSATERYSFGPEDTPLEIVFHGGMSAGQHGEAFLHITPEATPAQRVLAFDFNVSCLYRLGGCKSSAEMVPAWWQIEKSKPPVTPPE